MTQQAQIIESLTDLSDFIDLHGLKDGVIAPVRVLVQNDVTIEQAKQWAYDATLKCVRNVQVSTALNLFQQYVIADDFDEKYLDLILENVGFDYGFIVIEPDLSNPCLYFLREYEDETTPVGILGLKIEISSL
jgi:hypothetical protein